MRLLTVPEVLLLHERIISENGGGSGLRDSGALLSALSQPNGTFDGNELYPTLEAKAAALCFFLVSNHPFVDGNKRVGHAAMETVLLLNGFEIDASIDEQEELILSVASGRASRETLTDWLRAHIRRAT